MRLRTCIALELGVAMGAVAGVWAIGTAIGSAVAEHPIAATTRGLARTVEPLPGAELVVPMFDNARRVFGADDAALLAPLGATPVTKLAFNRGGSSLSLRIDFASGARAAFKPQQTYPQSDPRREIAAYRVDRLLGIGRVPPAKAVRFQVADLIAAAEPTHRAATTVRFAGEAIVNDGVVLGELSWWIPEISNATIGGFRIDDPQGVEQWSRYLQVGATIPPEVHARVTQIATMIVFDVLIDNADRWSGNNIKSSPDQKTLYFMDNTLSFSQFTVGHDTNLRPLRRIKVFPRALVHRLRGLTLPALESALAGGDDPLQPLLQPAEIAAVLTRRDHILAYVDALVAQFGESAVLAL